MCSGGNEFTVTQISIYLVLLHCKTLSGLTSHMGLALEEGVRLLFSLC